MGWRNKGLYPIWVQEFKAEFHSIYGREPTKDEIDEAYEGLDLGQWCEWAKNSPLFKSRHPNDQVLRFHADDEKEIKDETLPKTQMADEHEGSVSSREKTTVGL